MKDNISLSSKIVLTVIGIALVLLAALPLIDDIGREYTNASLKRALVTFGVARGLNGVISVAQGTEVAMEPAGVGVIFAPGQILDPVNDLIERFSWVMLASATSLGIQGLLLNILSSKSFILVAVVMVVIAVLLWWLPRISALWRRRMSHVAIVLLILRFMIPVMAVSSEGFYQIFLADEFDSSSKYLLQTRDTLGRINQDDDLASATGTADSGGWYESLRQNFESTLDAMDADQKVKAFQAAVEDLSEHTIKLIVIFIIQTILFPLLFLYLVSRSVKVFLRVS